jgi:16S rRNA (cytidine1402-2'-O)-methyltransferase
MIQESYKDSEKGTLYIVPTPIGNKDDITLRAIEILKKVDFICAEDTRTSSILLNMFNISKPLKACHIFNESKIKNKIVKELEIGKNVALISDQGTPLLSDPGYELVCEVIKNDLNVVSLPGPSALLPALNMSGIEANKFLFYGFLNSKTSVAKKELESLKNIEFTLVFYEAPHRLQSTLKLMQEIFGNRKISVSREISKLHEEIFRGTVEDAIEFYKDPKGEIVIVVEKCKKESVDINDLLKEVKNETKKGLSNKDAVKLISKKYGVSKNLLYNKNEEKRK